MRLLSGELQDGAELAFEEVGAEGSHERAVRQLEHLRLAERHRDSDRGERARAIQRGVPTVFHHAVEFGALDGVAKLAETVAVGGLYEVGRIESLLQDRSDFDGDVLAVGVEPLVEKEIQRNDGGVDAGFRATLRVVARHKVRMAGSMKRKCSEEEGNRAGGCRPGRCRSSHGSGQFRWHLIETSEVRLGSGLFQEVARDLRDRLRGSFHGLHLCRDASRREESCGKSDREATRH